MILLYLLSASIMIFLKIFLHDISYSRCNERSSSNLTCVKLTSEETVGSDKAINNVEERKNYFCGKNSFARSPFTKAAIDQTYLAMFVFLK